MIIELNVFLACLRCKQDTLHAVLKKCVTKEYYCDQYSDGNLWRRMADASICQTSSVEGFKKEKAQINNEWVHMAKRQ
ncbi:hypothetical protein KIN20_027275, partial [Parelaphostrongylus tenuis]